jgi:methionyl-tRNA formyltransferase
MGTPYFAIRPLEELAGNGYDVIAVYTQPDRPMGRGRVVDEPPVKKAALKLNLNVIQPENLKSTEEISRLVELKPDAIVVAAYGQILRQTVLDIPPFGCINIHPSLLPVYRGMSPVPSAILNGDEFTGVSIMLLDKGVDTGPVLERAQIPVAAQDDAGLLMEKLSRLGAQLLLDTLPRWFDKTIIPQPQNNANATYSKTLTKEAGKIDWNLSAMELWRRVRAYQPWPGCYTQWQGKQLKIIEAIPLIGDGNVEAGKVVAVKHESAAFGIRCGDGILGVIKVQMEGKKIMTADEFLRGQEQILGAVLG